MRVDSDNQPSKQIMYDYEYLQYFVKLGWGWTLAVTGTNQNNLINIQQ